MFCVMQIVKNTVAISLGLPRSLAIAVGFVFVEFGAPLKLFVF